ncbi:hypothetical protein AB0L75_40740 [Streptomyces sp. NPDC052101]|uniref:hypothetical protein n=1 Tax=Streptomyces sp. NPDC052101 TaxID=3155763 RepID=UPI00341BDB78
MPQARHIHVLLSGRAEAIETLLPGVTQRWLAAGARRIAFPGEAAMLAGTGWVR